VYGVLFLQSSKKLKLAAREFGIRDMVSVRVRASCHSGVSAIIDRPIVADTPIHELVTYYTIQTTESVTCAATGRSYMILSMRSGLIRQRTRQRP